MYASQQWPEERPDSFESPRLLDPTLLRAARLIYRIYREVHPEGIHRPLGVAIDRFTHRGHLVFHTKPALLMTESFVPFEQIESALY